MKYVLFDLDGTLTDPKEGITKCVQYALGAFGIVEDNLDNLTAFIGPPLIESFMKYYGFDEKNAWNCIEKYRERFEAVGKFENRVLDGVPQMLKKLKENGCKIALASAKPEYFAKQILEKYDLMQYFDFVKGADLNGRHTEKQSIIREVLEKLSVESLSEAVMVGDRLHDIVGAHNCGIKCIGVRFGYAEEGELEQYHADYIADTVGDLEKLLLEI